MTEKILRIIECENKVGKDSNKIYLKVKTDDTDKPWKSCFEKELIEKIRDNVGRKLCFDIADTEQWSNIKGIIEGKVEEVEVVKPRDNVFFEKKESVSAPKSDYEPKSMYVSYAKDIFCSVFQKGCNAREVMAECIELVKQANEAFKV